MFFVITLILIISMGTILFSEYSLFSNFHIVIAQSTNATNVLVPSNMTKMEITLKNDESVNPKSIVENPLLIALISGLTAILGGIMGSYMTNRSNRQMDDKRYDRESKREKEIEEQQEKEKNEFKQQVMASVYSELTNFSFWLNDLATYEYSADDMNTEKSLFETLRAEYPGMPFDVRLKMFSPELLYLVQSAYSHFEAYRIELLRLIEVCEKEPQVNFNEAVKNTEPSAVKDIVDSAIDKLEKALPVDLLKSFRETSIRFKSE